MDSPSTNLAWHYADGDISRPDTSPRARNPAKDHAASGQSQNRHNSGPQSTNSATPRTFSTIDHDRRPSMPNFPTQCSGGMNPEVDISIETGFTFDRAGPASASAYDSADQHQREHAHQGWDTRSYADAMSTDGGPSNGTNDMNMSYYQPHMFHVGQENGTEPGFPAKALTIESQEVDTSMLGLDMMPWFDTYPNHDMLNYFDVGAATSARQAESPNNKRRRAAPTTTMAGF